MSNTPLARRDWLKIGSLGSIAALLPQKARAQSPQDPEIKGIIFMVSDGMSHGVLSMAENFSKLVREKGTRWWQLLDDPKAIRGLMETSSADSYVTDSAAASSAWGGGTKVNNGSINIRPDGTQSEPVMRRLKRLGLRTGLVTTATVTHATPAGFAAVTSGRGDEHLIAPQYLNTVDIILGGGMKFFEKSKRIDSRDALTPFTSAGYELIRDRTALLASKSPRLLGLFSDDHIPFEIDRLNTPELIEKTPTLAEMSATALNNLLSHDEKFLLQIEGARIDHGAHANDIGGLLWDQLAFDDALAQVLELTSQRNDILIIVTSDHGNANPGLNGTGPRYSKSNNVFKRITRMTASYEAILLTWGQSKQNTPENLAKLISEKLGFKPTPEETQALYTSITGGDITEWSDQLDNPNGILGQIAGNHTGIGWTGVSHTSDPTIISAIGPQAHRFSGIIPNQKVYRHLLELLG